jgi:hypothetical protein
MDKKTGVTRQRVVEKFTELHKKYFVNRGCMISTLNDNFSKQFVETHPEIEWVHTYNRYAETDIQVAQINVEIFGKPFPVLLERPLKPSHRSEFECYFGFGGHCEGYTEFRMISRFPESFEEHSFNYEELLMLSSSEKGGDNNGDGRDEVKENLEYSDYDVDINYIKDVFKLLVIGGYVKYWKAFDELNKWFLDNIYQGDIDGDDIQKWLSDECDRDKKDENGLGMINKYIFEKYEVVQAIQSLSQ